MQQQNENKNTEDVVSLYCWTKGLAFFTSSAHNMCLNNQ